MGRNHFSKYGGPYFINDGFSHHSEIEEQAQADHAKNVILAIGFVIVLGITAVVVVL